jgi:hypothetical protein
VWLESLLDLFSFELIIDQRQGLESVRGLGLGGGKSFGTNGLVDRLSCEECLNLKDDQLSC